MPSTPDWRRLCTVAYLDEPPFFAPGPDGHPTGCDIELALMVFAELGVQEIEWVLTSFGELIDGVTAGRWDVNTPMFVTPERAERIRYSRPVWAAIDSVIVRSDDDRDFTSYESIAADPTIRVGAVNGQVQLDAALAAGVDVHRVVEFADQDSAARAVIAAEIDASVSTAPGNAAFVARLGDPRLRTIPDQGAAARGGLAFGAFSFRPDSDGLADAFDDALARLLGTERHMAMMHRYGFGDAELLAAIDAADR